MRTVLPEFKYAKVMVVGDIMLDRYWYGLANHISSEAPVPVVDISAIEERPGGAANVAMNIASLGASAHLVGLTGIDEAAQVLKKILTDVNVKCDFVSISTHSTIVKLRVLSHNQQLIRLDFEENFRNVDLNPLYERIKKKIENINVLVLSDYAKGTLSDVQQVIQLARKAGISVLVDPKGSDFTRYQNATLLTPNISEFEAVVGKCNNEEEIVKLGMKLIATFKVAALLITRSEKGMILLQFGKTPLQMKTEAREVYDVTGAGDTVIGVIAATLATGSTLEEACYFANIAAGIVVGKIGTSTILPIELENAVLSNSRISSGIISEETLKVVVAAAKKRGEKVVMTNGVFDILHAGHISYLKSARKLGDRLIVAVNSDASTKRLKGKKRPVNSLKQRMILLDALESVDWVVSFEESTPKRLIANILPDLLVKGGDYKPEHIAGSKEVWENGGEVVVLDFKNRYSTTKIIRKIQRYENKYPY